MEKQQLKVVDIRNRVRALPSPAKHKLFAIWMSKERSNDLKAIDLMLALDDEWARVYNEFRIIDGFIAASLKANERILDIVYGEDLKQ